MCRQAKSLVCSHSHLGHAVSARVLASQCPHSNPFIRLTDEETEACRWKLRASRVIGSRVLAVT